MVAFSQVLFNTISINVFSILSWHEDIYDCYAGT